MKISYRGECILHETPLADPDGLRTYVCGRLVTITKSECLGFRENPTEKLYIHKILEVETDVDETTD